jgi:hypothetical protein
MTEIEGKSASSNTEEGRMKAMFGLKGEAIIYVCVGFAT